MSRFLPLLILTACDGCRVSPGDTADPSVDLDLGRLPLGASLSLRLNVEGVDETTRLTGDGLTMEAAADGTLDLVWTPQTEGSYRGELVLGDQERWVLGLEVESPVEHWPAPIAAPTGLDSLASIPESGLGEAVFDSESAPAFAFDPVSGNAWFGDPTQGKAWRMDAFYNHPTWGLWVVMDRDTRDPWTVPPDCFEDQSGLLQDGTCDGSEIESDGRPPRGWRFFHGGFAGDGELTGLRSLVADPDRGRVWATGTGFIQAIDTDLYTTSDEGLNSYSFTQLVDDFLVELDPEWGSPFATLVNDRLWLLEPETGLLGVVDLPVETGPWGQEPTGLQARAITTDGDRLYVLESQALHILEPAAEAQLTSTLLLQDHIALSLPAPIPTDQPVSMVAHDKSAWIAWGDAFLYISETETRIHPIPDGGELIALALDRVEGGNAEPLEILYLAGQTDNQGWLRASTPEGGFLGEPLALPDVPIAMGQASEPHDLYLLYGAGETGCDAELAEFCSDERHPPVVQAFYNPYSLVPPTSAGHPLNLFLSPIVESPKDSAVNTDFTSGRVCTPGPDEAPRTELELGCCSLAWTMDNRLVPNVEYFELLATLGSDTESESDDPTLAWGINPSVLRQAWNCMESGNPEFEATGEELYLSLDALIGDRSTVTSWTHTALSQGDGTLNHTWWMDLEFEQDLDYDLPLDSQEEYDQLHQALSLIYVPDALGASNLKGIDLSSTTGAGNSLDAIDILQDEDQGGWPEDNPSWVVPIRDGPLIHGGLSRNAYYFLAAGTDPSIGTSTYRKKELWPVDLRLRAAVSELPETAEEFGLEGSSGLYNLPGMSWEIGTLVNLSEAGAYRESQMYGQVVTEENWEFVFRTLRRLIAMSTPETTKSWYQHIFDVTNPSGLFTSNSRVTEAGSVKGDVTAAALLRIQSELIEPGYARWSLPEEIASEASAD